MLSFHDILKYSAISSMVHHEVVGMRFYTFYGVFPFAFQHLDKEGRERREWTSEQVKKETSLVCKKPQVSLPDNKTRHASTTPLPPQHIHPPTQLASHSFIPLARCPPTLAVSQFVSLLTPSFFLLFLELCREWLGRPAQFQTFRKLSQDPVLTAMPSLGIPVQLTLLSCPDSTPERGRQGWDIGVESVSLVWWVRKSLLCTHYYAILLNGEL